MDLPPQDYAKYKWRVSDANAKSFRRYAAGSERFIDFLNRGLSGQNDIYFGLKTSLTTPTDAGEVLRAARQAWAALRFRVPVIASSTELDKDGEAYLSYQVATGLEEVRGWADRVVAIQDAVDMDTARVELGKNVVLPDEMGQQTHLFVVPQSTTEYGFLLRTHHTPFDGVGCCAVMDQFFPLFVKFLPDVVKAERELASLQWGEEIANLLPAPPEIVASNEPLIGADYAATMGEILTGMGTTFPVRGSPT
jgi:hypothetical protein